MEEWIKTDLVLIYFNGTKCLRFNFTYYNYLIGSACCSGVEAAFLAVNSISVLELASRQKPKSSANQLLKLRKHLGRTLTVITITNNGFNIIGSLILGVYGALVINNSYGLTLFSIAFYILVVLVGEVLPKALGTDNNAIWTENLVPRALGSTSPTKTTNI